MKEFIVALSLVFFVFYLIFAVGSCIPKVPDQVVEEVRACYIPEPYPKPKLPTVEYITVGEFKCFADSEQEQNAVKREVYKTEYCNNMLDLYNDARERCNE